MGSCRGLCYEVRRIINGGVYYEEGRIIEGGDGGVCYGGE